MYYRPRRWSKRQFLPRYRQLPSTYFHAAAFDLFLRANSRRHTRHDTDRTVLSCLVWRRESSRPDRPTSAFSVGVCRAAQAVPVRPPDALRRRTHLSGGRAGSIHTARHDRDRTVLSCQAGGVNWALVSAGVAVASLGIPTKFITDVDSGPVGTGIGDRLRVGNR